MKRSTAAYGSVLLAGCLWGIISIFVRRLSAAGFNSMEIVGIRAFFAAAVFLILVLIRDKSMLKIHRKDLWLFLGTGIASIVFFNFCYFRVIQISGASTASLLLYTAPAMVLVLSIPVLHEQLSKQKLCALLLTILGLLFVTGIFSSRESFTISALLFGLGSGLGYALYSIFSKLLMMRQYHSLTITVYTFIFAAAGSLPFLPVKKLGGIFLQPDLLLQSLGIGVLCTVLPFLSYTSGLKRIDAGQASVIAAIEPVVATCLGILAYHEPAGAGRFIGMVLILSSVVILNLRPTGRRKKHDGPHLPRCGKTGR